MGITESDSFSTAGSHTDNGAMLAQLAALTARQRDSLDEVIDAMLQLMSDPIGVKLSMIYRLGGDSLVISDVRDRIGLGVLPRSGSGAAGRFVTPC